MGHPFKHLKVISRHRHQVIKNAFHLGIFFFSLHHDLSKLSLKEFAPSAKYFDGKVSPVYKQRLSEGYFSSICQHHTRKNKHHWEYWTDFFRGSILAKTMPYKWSLEYVADVISASMTYGGDSFKASDPYDYFLDRSQHYFMTSASKEFILWCFESFKNSKWKNLKKKITKLKYKEIVSKHDNIEIFETMLTRGEIK